MFIYKDYSLKDGVLSKSKMKSNHLLYKKPYSGSPAIDASNVWLPHHQKIEQIKFRVKYESGSVSIFEVDKETFEKNKQEINFGFGVQYAIPKSYWTVTEE